MVIYHGKIRKKNTWDNKSLATNDDWHPGCCNLYTNWINF